MKKFVLSLLIISATFFATDATARADSTKKSVVKSKKKTVRKYDPLVYRVIPNCVECRATGYYVEGTEAGNGNTSKKKYATK